MNRTVVFGFALEHIFGFLDFNKEYNPCILTCKQWWHKRKTITRKCWIKVTHADKIRGLKVFACEKYHLKQSEVDVLHETEVNTLIFEFCDMNIDLSSLTSVRHLVICGKKNIVARFPPNITELETHSKQLPQSSEHLEVVKYPNSYFGNDPDVSNEGIVYPKLRVWVSSCLYGFPDLAKCLNLRCVFVRQWCESLPELHQIEELHMSSVENLHFITHLKNLKKIHFFNGMFTNLEELKQLPKLETLKLLYCCRLEDVSALDEIPTLHLVEIAHCSNIETPRKDDKV